mgnify:CR=1 FL=1
MPSAPRGLSGRPLCRRGSFSSSRSLPQSVSRPVTVAEKSKGTRKRKWESESKRKTSSEEQVWTIQYWEMMDRERGNAVNGIMIQIQTRIKEMPDLEKPASQPVNQSVSRPAGQSASQSVSWSAGSQPVSQTVSQSVRRAISQSDR